MEVFEITGPVQMNGEIHPQGAKNEALQVICATLLTDQPVVIRNIPAISDVLNLIKILEALNVKVEKLTEHDYRFQADDLKLENLESRTFFELGGSLRGSVMLLGPMLARFGRGLIPRPGGDKIGRRRLDTHFSALEKMGIEFKYDPNRECFDVKAGQIQGTYIHMEEPSVTGTANVLMAASMAKGQTVIYNAACEPYLQQLSWMVDQMGGKVEGIGTNQLIVEGVNALSGCEHRCLADIIEVGSFMGMAAMTGSALTIKNAGVQHLGIIPSTFGKLGIHYQVNEDEIHIPAHENSYEAETFMDGSILTISDGPWPMFTPDLLSIALVVATQAKGNVLIHQKMFESRLFFVDSVIDMGGQVILCDPHRATVMGLGRSHKLRGIKMRSPDIRAGVALLIAALSAEGTSTIFNVDQIDRGYEKIDERLNTLGAGIKRLTADFHWSDLGSS